MVRITRRLAPGDASITSVLVQEGSEPLVRGSVPYGCDYLCNGCAEVMAANIADGQLWDIGFVCSKCRTVSASPLLLINDPLPDPYTLLPSRRHSINRTIDLGTVGMIGVSGLSRIQKVDLSKKVSFKHDQKDVSVVGDEDFLGAVLCGVRTLLGDSFERLREKDDARIAGGVSASKRHPLMVAWQSLRESVESLRTPLPSVNATAAVELYTLLNLLEKWAYHPGYARLLHSLTQHVEYLHTLGLLTVACLLQDAGNSVDFVAEGVSRTPDLRLRRGYVDCLRVEVKAPLALVRPEELIAEDEAERAVRSALRRAGTGKRGQLASAEPAVLAIAGLHMPPEAVDRLEAAAIRYLKDAAARSRHKHLEAIQIANAAILADNLAPDRIEARFMLQSRVVRHPGFKGPSSLVAESRVRLNQSFGPYEGMGDGPIEIGG